MCCSEDGQTAEPRPPATDKKKRKTRRRTTDNRPLLTIKTILPEKEDLTVTCDLDTGKALVAFDFDCNHDTADIIIKNLVSSFVFLIVPSSFISQCGVFHNMYY